MPYWEKQGFIKADSSFSHAIERLHFYIDFIPQKIRGFSETDLLSKPGENKWSKKEILGHLIDSAINNLKRFTEIPFASSPYQLISYQQNELVTVNHYQNLPLDHLIILWQSLNRQIIYVMQHMPAEKLEYPVDPNYDNKEIKTLGWIFADYVAHMEHHMEQLKIVYYPERR